MQIPAGVIGNKTMFFFGSSTIDLKITIFLLVVSFLISLVVLLISRKIYLAILVFSILGNISFLLNIGSEMFRDYGIMWLGYFSLFVWPLLNIFLIVYYTTRPKSKK